MESIQVNGQEKLSQLLNDLQSKGRAIEIFQGQKVVAIISPVKETTKVEVECSDVAKPLSCYQTWGESLKDFM